MSATGPSTLDPEFILGDWSVPLYEYHPDGGQWALDADGVVGLLNKTHTRMKANGYAYTDVVDRAVRAYHRNGAATEVIWSRRRADGSEIERLGSAFRGDTHGHQLADRRHSTPTHTRRPAVRRMGGCNGGIR